jgi:DNA replication protein DnaC
LGFRSPPETLRSLLEELTKTKASPAQVCERLFVIERRERDARNLKARTRMATLGSFKTLDLFDWNHPTSIDKLLYEQMYTLEFIEHAENALFRGSSGLGKTTLAQNLGLCALAKGYTVRFSTLAAALADLLKQESLPAFERRLKRYTLTDLLILDELGYLPCDSRSADILYNIISRRHEKRSTIISTNLAFKQWSTIFPGAACLVALVDRFSQHCHVVDIEGESWRQKENDEPPPRRLPKRRRGRPTNG